MMNVVPTTSAISVNVPHVHPTVSSAVWTTVAMVCSKCDSQSVMMVNKTCGGEYQQGLIIQPSRAETPHGKRPRKPVIC